MSKKKIFFSNQIVHWNQFFNQRNMPWKGEKNAYKIWISEIILQQTRVEQGWNYYENFIASYPNVQALAQAPEDDVLKLWQGLGYYSRARNLHKTAKQIVAEYNGQLPASYYELIKLPGIGAYTAAAISSFAFSKAHAVVDGNVIRVLARFFALQENFSLLKNRKKIDILANELIDKKNPGIYNQAIMDFGATVCTPHNPSCIECPLQSNCQAYKQQLVTELPVKKKKLVLKKRYFIALHIKHNNKTLIQQRIEKDIWQNLYQLPLLELPKNKKQVANEIDAFCLEEFGSETKTIKQIDFEANQKLSHQHIYLRCFSVQLEEYNRISDSFQFTQNLSTFAFPKIFILFFQNNHIF